MIKIKFSELNLRTRLLGGFSIIIILIIMISANSVYKAYLLADVSNRMFNHPFTVSNAVRDIQIYINAMHRSMKDFALAQNEEQLENAVKIVNKFEKQVLDKFEIVFTQFLGDPKDVQIANKVFVDWKVIREEVIYLMRQGEVREAAGITEGKGADHVNLLFDKTRKMIDFANSKAESFNEEANDIRESTLLQLIILAIALIIISLLIAGVITRSVADPIERIIDKIRRISKEQYNYDITLRETNQITMLNSSVDELGKLSKELTREITERRQSQLRLEEANKELESFSYSVSHDLRAPLRHIDGYIGLLKQHSGESLDEKSNQYVSVISDSARRLGSLIDDLLDFSKMGRAEMQKSRSHLEPLIKEAQNKLQHMMEGRDIIWKIGTFPEIHADPAMMELAMVNLISNAIKFTRPRKRAKIEIGLIADNQNEHVFFIRDNGVGFDMKYVNKLFGVFQRLHREDEFEGTGIGLANVRRIIHRHGGRTWAEGIVGKGATFYFSLPVGGK